MSEQPMPTENGTTPTETPKNLPPFVTVAKTPEGCQVQHNLIDPWLAVALLEMGKENLLESMRPKLVKPGSMAGIMQKMGRVR